MTLTLSVRALFLGGDELVADGRPPVRGFLEFESVETEGLFGTGITFLTDTESAKAIAERADVTINGTAYRVINRRFDDESGTTTRLELEVGGQ